MTAATEERRPLVQSYTNTIYHGTNRMFSQGQASIRIYGLMLLAMCIAALSAWHLTQHHNASEARVINMDLEYSSQSNPRSINVSYDARSIRINNDPTILLAGSMHPVRATKSSWIQVLEHAVAANLNMITIYTMWSYHQPLAGKDIDWTLPGGDWDLATALWEAASRGLFVHVRIGPYTCAEYSYGGILEWVPLVYGENDSINYNSSNNKTRMSLRRPNKAWYRAMKTWVKACVGYLTDNELWANQGGPIILAQIENELGGEVDPTTEHLDAGSTLQDYADWCGDLALEVQPDAVWTMCNGLSANTTINTCNGYGDDGACSTNWLEQRGQNGRIQVDQPALWTESEMGFQIWGESPLEPSDYFWGRTARDVTGDVLRWFARGGSHVNHYMFWGGYNRADGSAAGGITNAYATDAPVCSHGQPRQPKFDHMSSMHQVIASLSDVLTHSPTALGKEISLKHRKAGTSEWKLGTSQVAFGYGGLNNKDERQNILFVENNSNDFVKVQVPHALMHSTSEADPLVLQMQPWEALVVGGNGTLLFSSANIDPEALAYRRVTIPSVPIHSWETWEEPINKHHEHMRGVELPAPVMKDHRPWELTHLLLHANMSTDYVWYSSTFNIGDVNFTGNASITIETQKASAVTVFLGETFIGDTNSHEHADGDTTFHVTFPSTQLNTRQNAFNHTLSILYESLGFGNIIGRWGVSAAPKTKGITGNVWINATNQEGTKVETCLTCGQHIWYSQAGLQGHTGARRDLMQLDKSLHTQMQAGHNNFVHLSRPCTWSSAQFATPSNIDHSKQVILLKIKVGRGKVWLNGSSLGRYWNITRGGDSGSLLSSPIQSQEYYQIPPDFVRDEGEINELLFFNSLGGDLSKSTQLVVSWLDQSNRPTFQDEIGLFDACLY